MAIAAVLDAVAVEPIATLFTPDATFNAPTLTALLPLAFAR